MKIQLLLLVALAGTFCAFTRASPTALPNDDNEAATGVEVNTDINEALTVVTGPPSRPPSILPELQEAVGTTIGPSADDTDSPMMGMTSPEAHTVIYVSSSIATTKHLASNPPAVETATPAAATEKAGAEVTAAVELEPEDKVVIKEGTDEATEGLSSGQVAGIVIGALLAVVIVIAVVIAAVRRMGKYSP